MEYAEYLRSQGASDDDIKALTEGSFSGVAKKAFAALQTQVAEEVAARVAEAAARQQANQDLQNYETWYSEKAVPAYKEMESKVIVATANEAKAKAALNAAREAGLIDVAKDLGYETTPASGTPVNNTNPGNPGFDPNKYFTREDILAIAEREGDAIALAQDIAAEHRVLFPGQALNFRELRKEAVAAKKPVEQLWMERYKVPEARASKAKAEHEAEVAKWKAEGAKEKETELVSKYGNPETRPMVPSTSPFTQRPAVGRDKQPWEIPGGDDALSNDRVKRATQKLISGSVQ